MIAARARRVAAVAGWLTLALISAEADAQHRRRQRRAEPRPDAATLRRCGAPLLEAERASDIDSGIYPEGRPRGRVCREPFWCFRWPPGSPCDLEQAQERLRLARVRSVADDSIVPTCWRSVRGQGSTTREVDVQIRLAVDTRGVVTVASVRNSPDPRFTSCLRTGMARVHSVGPGRRDTVTLSVGLGTGG